MHILVTGSCGFVGTALTQKLLDLGHQITGVDTMWFGNHLNPHQNLRLFQVDVRNIYDIPMENVDTIIHLANISNDPCGELNAKLSWEVNVLTTMHMLEKAIDSKVERFIFASSGSVYGVKDEEKVTEELKLVPISDYNKTKMISERVIMSYSDKISTVCVRPATVCGYSPRTRLDLSVNMLTMQALERKKITVFGGQQTRPNIHLQDMIGAYLHFLNHPRLEGVYNAGFENISILQLAEQIKKHIPDTEIEVTESNDPRSYRLCSDKLLATGFQPKFSIEDGIKEIIEHYKSGRLVDSEEAYNLKVMNKLGIGRQGN